MLWFGTRTGTFPCLNSITTGFGARWPLRPRAVLSVNYISGKANRQRLVQVTSGCSGTISKKIFYTITLQHKKTYSGNKRDTHLDSCFQSIGQTPPQIPSARKRHRHKPVPDWYKIFASFWYLFHTWPNRAPSCSIQYNHRSLKIKQKILKGFRGLNRHVQKLRIFACFNVFRHERFQEMLDYCMSINESCKYIEINLLTFNIFLRFNFSS